MNKIGFGGGCHWCTEAVFQSLRGVTKVSQGWIASTEPNDAFSEAVIVEYSDEITIDELVQIHLLTHSSSSLHSMRDKYRSAVYYFDESQRNGIENRIARSSAEDRTDYITRVLPFADFRENREDQLQYYLKNKNAPFCQTYIHPKLKMIRERHAKSVRHDF